ncbi:MAG: hypothetical protein LBC22_03940, partial [Endomicrobium sp.]|nr:hypothetical protein [Endomicrobium sp.]
MVQVREKLYEMYIVFLIMLMPGIGIAGQIINVVNHSTFSVAGNGSTNVVNYGQVMIMDVSEEHYVSPSSYGGNDDSNNNIINVSTSVTIDCDIYGGYSVLSNAMTSSGIVPKDKMLSSPISMSGNTININSSVTDADRVRAAYVKVDNTESQGSNNISALTATNNTIILSESDLSLRSNLRGVYIDVPSGVVQNWNVHDNALYVNNAKNV